MDKKDNCSDIKPCVEHETSVENYVESLVEVYNSLELTAFLMSLMVNGTCCPISAIVLCDAIRGAFIEVAREKYDEDPEKLKRLREVTAMSSKFCEKWVEVASEVIRQEKKAQRAAKNKGMN